MSEVGDSLFCPVVLPVHILSQAEKAMGPQSHELPVSYFSRFSFKPTWEYNSCVRVTLVGVVPVYAPRA